MTLISCPRCQREVSDKAKACPHCGVLIADPLNTADEGSSSSLTSGWPVAAGTAPPDGDIQISPDPSPEPTPEATRRDEPTGLLLEETTVPPRRHFGLVAVAVLVVGVGFGVGWMLSGNSESNIASDTEVVEHLEADGTEIEDPLEPKPTATPLPHPTPTPEIEPTPEPLPPLDLVAIQAHRAGDVYQVRFIGCGGTGVASATLVDAGTLATGPDVARAGWLIEVESLGRPGTATAAVLRGRTADNLALLDVVGSLPAASGSSLPPSRAGVGDEVAVVGLPTASSPTTIIAATIASEGIGIRTVEVETDVEPTVVGSSVFDSEAAMLGVVSAVNRTTLTVLEDPGMAISSTSDECDPTTLAAASAARMSTPEYAAFALAQELATALADDDWNRVRELDTPKAGYPDSRFRDGWGALVRSTLVPGDVSVSQGSYTFRLLLVAHEQIGNSRVTKPFCVTWDVDLSAGTVVQTGINSFALAERAGWIDPGEYRETAATQC